MTTQQHPAIAAGARVDANAAKDQHSIVALSVNTVLEAMEILHKRRRMTTSDAETLHVVNAALGGLQPASLGDRRTIAISDENVASNPKVRAMIKVVDGLDDLGDENQTEK